MGWQVHQIPSSAFWATPTFSIHSLLVVRIATTRQTQLRREASQRALFHLQSLGEKAKVYTYQIGKRACSLLQASVLSHGEKSPRSLAWHEKFSSKWSTEFSISHAFLGEPKDLVSRNYFLFLICALPSASLSFSLCLYLLSILFICLNNIHL